MLPETDTKKDPVVVSKADDKAGSATGSALKLPDIPPVEDEGGEKTAEDSKTSSGRSSEPRKPSSTPPPYAPEDDFEALTKRFAALKKK